MIERISKRPKDNRASSKSAVLVVTKVRLQNCSNLSLSLTGKSLCTVEAFHYKVGFWHISLNRSRNQNNHTFVTENEDQKRSHFVTEIVNKNDRPTL